MTDERRGERFRYNDAVRKDIRDTQRKERGRTGKEKQRQDTARRDKTANVDR
jgi:hypothetical protein